MIRRAKTKDAEAIASIYNYYIEQGDASMDTLRSTEDIIHWIELYVDREGVFVWEENNSIKGWVVLKKYSDRYGYRFAGETSIYVHPSCKGKGIGKKLKRFIINKAKDKEYKHLTAKIFAQNNTSINFFKQFGYTLVGVQHRIGFRDNKWVDMVIMELLVG